MIEISNVVKKFDDYTAVDGISLKVENSSIYGIVGYNGAGKTTLLKMIAGVYSPDSGEIKINGVNLIKSPSIKQDLFYIPDDIYFGIASSLKQMAKFYKGYHPNFSMNTFYNLADLFELNINKKINSFSKGLQRQAEIVLGLSCLPKIMLLDESFDGLDPSKRNLTKKLLVDYMADKGCSIIISSHNLHELADMCDHIALINGQHIVIDCAVDDMNGSRCKFRLAFKDDIEESAFSEIAYKNFNKDKKIISFTVSNNIDEVEKKIEKLNPVLIERFPLSLEEIFMEEMEDKKYDFYKIF